MRIPNILTGTKRCSTLPMVGLLVHCRVLPAFVLPGVPTILPQSITPRISDQGSYCHKINKTWHKIKFSEMHLISKGFTAL